jgi:hypothetical protein
MEAEIVRERYRVVGGNLAAAEMALALEDHQLGEQFKIIEPARVPARPIGPPLWPYVLVGALVGIACRALVALVSRPSREPNLRGAPVSA